MCSNLIASERELQPIHHASYIHLAKHTSVSSTKRTVTNEVTLSTFFTFKEQNENSEDVIFTVEDYLRNLTETQHMTLIKKTKQNIETLLELKKKARETIMSIP